MKKNVLIISSSPRKNGNSDTLCNEFLRGATESGNNVEKIFLINKNINYCVGCRACSTTHKCPQNDDMNEILTKMVEADVIVLATPVYFYSMNAQLKTLIDRTIPRYTEISNKDFYFILTAGINDPNLLKRTVEALRGFTEDCLTNSKEKGIIYGVGVSKIGDIKNTQFMNNAYEMGKNI